MEFDERIDIYSQRIIVDFKKGKTKFVNKTIDNIHEVAYNRFAGRDTLYTHITEFTFKCHVLAPAVGPPKGGFLR